MRVLSRVTNLWRSWFGARQLDDELDAELAFHLQCEAERLIARGVAPEEAARQARLSLHGVDAVRADCREGRTGAGLRQFATDLRFGFRLFRRQPSFSAVAVAVVALGIGAATAIFSVVYAVVLSPLPYEAPDRLVAIWSRMPRLGLPRALVNAADYEVWRRDNQVFTDIALVRPIANFNLTEGGPPERIMAARISPNLLDVLGVVPARGRGFRPEEARPGADREVLLGDGLWARRFGRDPSIVGKTIVLSGTRYEVVGVMPPDFRYPTRDFDAWTPLTVSPAELSRQDGAHDYRAIARLRPGATLERAQADLSTICARLAREFPSSNRDVDADVEPLLDDTVRTVRVALQVLLGAVCSLLLIACLNLSNLLGARASARRAEFALRASLGASRGRLMIQAVGEVIPIVAAGGILGVLAAWWAVQAFIPLAPPTLPRVEVIGLNAPVLGIALIALVGTGLAAALVSALGASRPGRVLREEQGRTVTTGRGEARRASALVVLQIGLVLPLVMAALLLSRSFVAVSAVEPGFRPDGVLTLHLAIPRSKYPSDAEVARVTARFAAAAGDVPGVESAGLVNRLPLSGIGQIGGVQFDGFDEPPFASADWRSATPGYFAAMGIPLREGRLPDGHDTAGSERVALIDEVVARKLWPGRSAIGRRLRANSADDWSQIIGVVGHVRNDGLDVDTRPQVYWPVAQRAQDRMVLVVRGRDGVPPEAARVVDAIRSVDPEQAVYDVRTMGDVVSRSLGERWLSAALVGAFAGMALLLAAVGLYGVIAFAVTRRRREFGIRLALGATAGDIARSVVRQALLLTAAGVTLGGVTSLSVGGLIAGLLYDVSPRDLTLLAVACGVLLGAGVAAGYLPAMRAARVDPATTLRSE